MPLSFNSRSFEDGIETSLVATERPRLAAMAHRAQELINENVRVKTGLLRLSTDNWAADMNGGPFRPPRGAQQIPAPSGASIDRAILRWQPGDGFSTRSLLAYAFRIDQDRTFEIVEAQLAQEGA